MRENTPSIHHRRSIRLKGYDYSQAGLYFITICTKHRKCLFGEVENHKIELNGAGVMVNDEWLGLVGKISNIILHDYIIMPNHFHAILEISATNNSENQKAIGDIIGAFKSITTVEYIHGVKNHQW